ncbi:MAG: hypothetical protein RIC35_08680 [Marinoscillum sp.]
MRRLFFTFLLWTGFLGIYSCILDCPEVFPYWDLNDFSIEVRDVEFNLYSPGEEFLGDTMFFNLDFQYEYLEFEHFSFLNSATALEKCDESGDRGAKDPIVALEFTSDQAFNEIASGELLNYLVRIYPLPT